MKITFETDLWLWHEAGGYIYGYNARKFLQSIRDSDQETMLYNNEPHIIYARDIYDSLQAVIEDLQETTPDLDISDLLCYEYEWLCRQADVPDLWNTFRPNLNTATDLIEQLPDTAINKCAKMLFGVISMYNITIYPDDWEDDLDDFFRDGGSWADYISSNLSDIAPDFYNETELAIFVFGLTGDAATKYSEDSEAGKIDPARGLEEYMAAGFEVLCEILTKSDSHYDPKDPKE